MSTFVSSRHAGSIDFVPNLCGETPFRNDGGPTRALSCEFPERPVLEIAQCWD